VKQESKITKTIENILSPRRRRDAETTRRIVELHTQFFDSIQNLEALRDSSASPRLRGEPEPKRHPFGFTDASAARSNAQARMWSICSCMVRDIPLDPPIIWGAAFNYCIADPPQAPPGQYTVLTWAMVPYELKSMGGPQKWDDLRESYADKVEEVLVQYLQNLKTSKIARYVNTPHDYVRRNPHCGGNMHPSGAVTEGQMWSWKPFAGCNAPRTPISRFYICQSGGAANYTNLSAGTLAANVIRDDVGQEKPDWWNAMAFDGAAQILRREGVTQRFTVD